MRMVRTTDLLRDEVATFHRELAEILKRRAAEEIPPRVRLLVEYLAEYEVKRAEAIDRFLAESSHDPEEDAWIPLPDSPPALDPLLSADQTFRDFDRLVGALLASRRSLIDYLASCACCCRDDSSRATFLSLRGQEERGMRRFVRQIQGLSDL